MSLQYYDDERDRWPQLNLGGQIGQAEALEIIRRLCARFYLSYKELQIVFTNGRRRTWARKYAMTFNIRWLNYRTICHELAHVYHLQKTRRGGERYHGRKHAQIVDRMCGWLIEQKIHLGSVAHEIALEEIERAKRDVEQKVRAAMPEPVESKIAHRVEQIKRLERKVKSLTTRLKSARRSLAALQRSAQKKTTRPISVLSAPRPVINHPPKKSTPPKETKTPLGKIIDLAKRLGAKVDHDSSQTIVDAPTGYVWASEDIHYLIEPHNQEDRQESYDDLFQRMSQGLVPCKDLQCDSCHPNGDK